MEDFRNKPIPILPDPEQYTDTAFIDSPLVELHETDRIELAMQYPVRGCRNAETRSFLRKEVAEMLEKASLLLPDGYRFRIWDVWRPFALQEELFESYSEMITKEFHLENLSQKEREAEIGKFVANPVDDVNLPPAHTTGGSIDLTIVGPDDQELEFGTAFDEFTIKTRAAYFETKEAEKEKDAEIIRGNRRFLYHTMLEAGFTNLPSEWWHYEYGDKNWAYAVKKPALYKGIFKLEDAGL